MERLEVAVKGAGNRVLKGAVLMGPSVGSIESLKCLRVEVPNRYEEGRDYNSRKQCSPGDMLVTSAWATY